MIGKGQVFVIKDLITKLAEHVYVRHLPTSMALINGTSQRGVTAMWCLFEKKSVATMALCKCRVLFSEDEKSTDHKSITVDFSSLGLQSSVALMR